MTPDLDAIFDEAMDVATQVTTAMLHGDRTTGVGLVEDFAYPSVLAVCLADVAVYVHEKWSIAVGMHRATMVEGWAKMMLDAEHDRTRR